MFTINAIKYNINNKLLIRYSLEKLKIVNYVR